MSIKNRLLALLSDGNPHPARELAAITHRFGAVLHSLREEGYKINTIRVSHNTSVYQLLAVSALA
jgi:hypothetical protein